MIIPKGNTKILVDDEIYLVILSQLHTDQLNLYQIVVEESSEYLNQTLEQLDLNKHLIVALERNGKVIVPNGQTIIKIQDRLLIQKKYNMYK